MKKIILFIILALSLLLIVSCTPKITESDSSFEKFCKEQGKEWMKMMPMTDGVLTEEPSCYGCMINDNTHVCSKEKYISYNYSIINAHFRFICLF